MPPADLAVVSAAVSGAVLVIHAAAADILRLPPAGRAAPRGAEVTARRARAWAGAGTALSYFTVSVAAIGGLRLPGLDGVTAGELLVFSVMQGAWLASTTWDVTCHRTGAR